MHNRLRDLRTDAADDAIGSHQPGRCHGLQKVLRHQPLPSARDQEALAEFALGQWLWTRGRTAAAERHFLRGGELAPHDFTIRRGTMPMRGIDPMGPEFRAMLQSWVAGGQPYYRPLPDTDGRVSRGGPAAEANL